MSALPKFEPYFNVNTPLPAARDRNFGGYVLGLPEERYRSFPAANYSIIKQSTPCQMLHAMMEPPEDHYGTPSKAEAFTLGTLLHWAVLEQWKFAEPKKHIVDCPTDGMATVKAHTLRTENPGKLVANARLVDEARLCMDAVLSNDRAMAWASGIDPDRADAPKSEIGREVSGFVWDAVYSIWRKIRLDLFLPSLRTIIDVKTTVAPLTRWWNECQKNGYFDQAAYYLDTHYKLTGEWCSWRWVVVTKSEPFMCRVFRLVTPKPSDPLYEESQYGKARKRLGLDAGLQIGRLPMFVNSARQTEDFQRRGVAIGTRLLRQTWPGYEDETPEYEIF